MLPLKNMPETGRPGVKAGSPTDLGQCQTADSEFVPKIHVYYGLPLDKIPMSDERKLTSKNADNATETATAITASKSTKESLKAYGWVFSSDVSDSEEIPTIQATLTSFETWQSTALTVPSWDLNAADGSIKEFDFSLRLYEKKFAGRKDFILRAPSNDVPTNTFSPGVVPVQNYSHLTKIIYNTHSTHLAGLKDVITAFSLEKPESELAAQQSVGRIMKGFFYDIADTVYTGDKELDQPTILGCYGSKPKADLLTRMVLQHDKGHEWKRRFDPVIAVGEAKLLVHPHVPAQMACSLTPTFHVFMALLAKQWKDKPENKGKYSVVWSDIIIPDWMWICGITFDGDGVCFHGFRPVVRRDKYEFISWNISGETFTKVFVNLRTGDRKPHAADQINLLKALIWMWRHTSDLKENITKLKFDLPPPFRDLSISWGNKPMGFKQFRQAQDLKRKQKEAEERRAKEERQAEEERQRKLAEGGDKGRDRLKEGGAGRKHGSKDGEKK